VAGTICRIVLSILALGDLLSRDKDILFIQNTLGPKKTLQSSPGHLRYHSPASSRRRRRGTGAACPLPVTISSCGSPLDRRNESLRGLEASSTCNWIDIGPPHRTLEIRHHAGRRSWRPSCLQRRCTLELPRLLYCFRSMPSSSPLTGHHDRPEGEEEAVGSCRSREGTATTYWRRRRLRCISLQPRWLHQESHRRMTDAMA
jgi:hypothetical protein